MIPFSIKYDCHRKVSEVEVRCSPHSDPPNEKRRFPTTQLAPDCGQGSPTATFAASDLAWRTLAPGWPWAFGAVLRGCSDRKATRMTLGGDPGEHR